MFFPGSRYLGLGTYTATRVDGTRVHVTRLHRPEPGVPIGYHRRLVGQRLDHLAANYLKDATAFWRLCDVDGTVVPDVLAGADLVGIPGGR